MSNRIGQELSHYRLIRLLGRGEFAEVYLGEHLYLNTTAAIKILQTRLINEDATNFINEARMIASLVHPHIVQVLDFDLQDGSPFLVMEYAPLGTLRQHYPGGVQLPPEHIVSHVKQIASALMYAHNHKVVHCDIKPENMLLRTSNEVFLSDFGIAFVMRSSRVGGTMEVMGTSAYMGTVGYMAPEQILGKALPASDQYSLGVVIYEWLTGERPFLGTFVEVVNQHMFVPPPPLRQKVPLLPKDVEEVVMMALAKDPQQRFQTIQTFANAFEQAVRSDLPDYLSPGLHISREELSITFTESLKQTAKNVSSSHVSEASPASNPSSDMKNYVDYAPSSSASSHDSSLSSYLKEKAKVLTKQMSRKGKEKRSKTHLSLFAIAHTELEANERAVVGNAYKIEAGISQRRIDNFQNASFQVKVQNSHDLILFDILFHPSDNIELLGAWYQQLRYDPSNPEPQLVTCPFRLRTSGQSSIIVNFYRERQWLKTIRFVFEGIEQSIFTPVKS